jgi:hypothetical protein
MKYLKMLTVFPKRTIIKKKMELLCKINTATNNTHENYLVINSTYINKFISFVFQKEEVLKTKTT